MRAITVVAMLELRASSSRLRRSDIVNFEEVFQLAISALQRKRTWWLISTCPMNVLTGTVV